jgi:hypothetical protein
MAPFGCADKPAEKILLADLNREKNIVPTKKTS